MVMLVLWMMAAGVTVIVFMAITMLAARSVVVSVDGRMIMVVIVIMAVVVIMVVMVGLRGVALGLRHTPVGNGLDGDTFWLVAVHGTQADYVHNIQAEPRVRVKMKGAWRAGTAVVQPDDDAVARSRTMPYQWDAAIGRMMASAPLTIRIDLDPPASAAS